MSWSRDYNEYDDRDSDDREEYARCVKIIDTFELVDRAHEIIDRLRTYALYNGLNMLMTGDCMYDMVDLLEMTTLDDDVTGYFVWFGARATGGPWF